MPFIFSFDATLCGEMPPAYAPQHDASLPTHCGRKVQGGRPNEFKVGSWGNKSDKHRRLIRKKMIESSVYLASERGRSKSATTRRINALRRIDVDDIIRLPMYKDGYEFVGTVLGYKDTLSSDYILQRYPEISHATWGGGGPSDSETFTEFNVLWEKRTLTDTSENELKRMVKDGGRCLDTNATIIRLETQ